MADLPLFDNLPPEPDPQDENLGRVNDRIGAVVVDFIRDRLASEEPCFHMEELRDYVSACGHIAPDSPGRILRDLRQKGLIDYRVLSRKSSLYEPLPAGIADD